MKKWIIYGFTIAAIFLINLVLGGLAHGFLDDFNPKVQNAGAAMYMLLIVFDVFMLYLLLSTMAKQNKDDNN